MPEKNNYKWLPTIAFLVTASHAYAAERPALTANSRFEENYEFLSDPAKRTDFFDPVKYIPLGDDPHTYLSFGGEVRERYEGFLNNPLFGLNHLNHDDYLLSRTLLSADLHVTPYFRSFVQLGHHDVYGKDGAITGTERSKFDLQQAFAEGDLPLGNGDKVTLRTGRQEMPLGSQRLVSFREGPNIRQSFDAIRAIYQSDEYSLTTFISRPVEIRDASFDDISDHKQDFWGIYGVVPLTKVLSTDLYYLGLNREDAHFAQGTAEEKRHSLGTRLWGKSGGFDYNEEAVYQFGTFGDGDIRAWTVASDNGYTFKDAPWTPRFGIKADIASGDKNKNNKDLNTFNALFPKGAYFTENALIGPANFIDLQPNITLKPCSDVMVNFGADILWRENTNDAIYRQPNVAIAGTAGKGGQYTGTQGFILSTWQIDPHVSLTATYVHFAVGDAIKHAGGGDDDYIGSWLTYRF